MFIGRTDADASALATWCKEITHWKWPWCWVRLRQEEKGTAEDEMVGWHRQLNGHEFEQAPGVGDGQGSLACCSLWGHEESEMTGQLNWAFHLCVCVCVCVCVHLSIYNIFFIHSIDRHLGCFHILFIVNNAAMNMGMHISFQVSVFLLFECIPKSRLPGSYGNCSLNFLRNLYSVFHSGFTNLHSHQQCIQACFFPDLCWHLLFLDFFHNSHSNGCEDFDFYFPNN